MSFVLKGFLHSKSTFKGVKVLHLHVINGVTNKLLERIGVIQLTKEFEKLYINHSRLRHWLIHGLLIDPNLAKFSLKQALTGYYL